MGEVFFLCPRSTEGTPETYNMKIGFTYDLRSDWAWHDDDPHDANAEFDKPETIAQIVAALESGGHDVVKIGNVDNLLKQLPGLQADIVFNICEGKDGRNRESQVPILLEMNRMPFVGSDALTLGLTLDKTLAKKCFVADGISTPRFFLADNPRDFILPKGMTYPLIVKTAYEGTSKGLTDQSRVDDLNALIRQVELIAQKYHQPALVEEFIRGTEFTVAVLGNNENVEAMPVVQVCIDGKTALGDLFYTHEYVTSSKLRYFCPAKISADLENQLRAMAIQAYRSVGCLDFGRVDFRVDEKGQPFVLEINPLPCLGKDDIFNVFPQVIGSTYDRVINRILDIALARYGLAQNETTASRRDQGVAAAS